MTSATFSTPAASLQRADSSSADYRLSRLLSFACIALAFIPYVGLPLGNATHLSGAALAGLAALLTYRRTGWLDTLAAVLLVIPLVANAIATVAGAYGFYIPALVTWVNVVGPFIGATIAALHSRQFLTSILKFLLFTSGAYAIIQWFCIKIGFVPFIQWYFLPGYADIRTLERVIVLYTQRPFGQFPEPSVLAASLTLGSLLLVVLVRTEESIRFGKLGIFALALSAAAVVLSQSATGIIGLGLLAVAVVSSAKAFHARLWGSGVILAAAVASSWVLDQRQSVQNYSWGDRVNSILVSLDYWVSDPQRLFLGLGRGGLSHAFTSGAIGLANDEFVQVPMDAYSALVRFMVEIGLGGGLVILLVFVWPFFSKKVGLAGVPRVSVFVAWLLTTATAVSYETVSMCWILPGALLGIARSSALDTGPRYESSR